MARRDPSVFELTAKGYGRVRPGYPDELFDFVVASTGLAADARLLELGCGPGLATEGFAARGYAIHAVDAADAMLNEARARLAAYDTVTYERARFETWSGPPLPVQLTYAGMAWHWLDPDVRDAKVASWTLPGGWLAILTNWPVGVWEEGQALYQAHWPDRTPSKRLSAQDRITQVRQELEDAAQFELRHVGRWPRVCRYTADVYVEVLDTYSDHVVLPPDIKQPFYAAIRDRIESLGGAIERSFESVAMLAQVRPQ